MSRRLRMGDLRRLLALIVRLANEVRRLRRENKHYKKLALTDAVTGLPNRHALKEYLKRPRQTILQSGREGSGEVAVLMLDLDGFKQVNDGGGHHTGDKMLELVAVKLKPFVRKGDLLIRWGGDEYLFVALIDKEEHLPSLAERIRQAVFDIKLKKAGRVWSVRASIGATLWQKKESGENAIRRADAAAYLAKLNKHGGKGAYHIDQKK